MRVLVTGSKGFIAKNLIVRLRELGVNDVVSFDRGDDLGSLGVLCAEADFVFHLAGVNRPKDHGEFAIGNSDLTEALCRALSVAGRKTPVAFASSTQAANDSAYGRSKRCAEQHLERYARETGAPAFVFRLPNVFGKWSRPNYNSAVATFCYNIARDLPVTVDPVSSMTLAYIDDVVASFVGAMQGVVRASSAPLSVEPTYTVLVREVADQIRAFRNCRTTLVSERVGSGLTRALYATYVSFLPTEHFAYAIPRYGDARGVFVEMLKTIDSGQFSFFSAHPGVTRGGHYHHTKTEKFLVVKGRAMFRFRHLITGERYEVETFGGEPQVVETIPGWAHDITNIGEEEMLVMLWANEIFDRSRPDTVASALT
jgi:UDP-2-acetamido-2,6-beta-L-arabino-hexul-4-ose reductase